MADAAKKPLPVVDFLKLPDGGEPYLEGHQCKTCQAIFIGARENCSKCGARGSMQTKKLSNKGTLYVYSIVHRSFPGVEVPYVSAVVDLEGGGTVMVVGRGLSGKEPLRFRCNPQVIRLTLRPAGSVS